MFKKLVRVFAGDPNKKIINELTPLVEAVSQHEQALAELDADGLRTLTAQFRERLAAGESLEDLLPEAFAAVRVASTRSTGLRHYDVQIMGGALLHRGEVVEMRTGEGKTLVATLPLYLNALNGQGVHLVTVNDYLARRDGGWMGKIFHYLGLSVGCIGPEQFSALYDPLYVNPGADLDDDRLVHWRPCTRQEAYQADITYGTASEFGFDYLRDNRATDPADLVQRDLVFAVIDEVDNVLIDDAKTPLIISGPADRIGRDYQRFAQYVRNLRRNTAGEDEEPNGDYDLDEKSQSVSLTDQGIAKIEERIPEIDTAAGDNLYDPSFFHLTYYLDNAMKAEYLYRRDVQYVVQDGRVVIVDESTGRLMPSRRYSEGLHEAIEAKEGVQIQRENVTIATITLQNYFRLYDKLAGMTGTALTDAEEFDKIYELDVTPLPTNVQYIVDSGEMGLLEKITKVENGQHVFYVKPDREDEPVFHKRIDFPDVVYKSANAKDEAIVEEIARVHETGRPVLVGTASVEHSETISRLLKKRRIPHNVLNAKIHQSEALVVAQAGRRGAVTISTNMAGRGTDILLGGNAEGLAAEALEKALFDRRALVELSSRLIRDGESPARQMARKTSRLREDLVDALLSTRSRFEAALAEIEAGQLLDFLARKLAAEYEVDFSEARQVLRLVRDRNFGRAREFVLELDEDVALVEAAAGQIALYLRFQAVHGDPQQLAEFLADQLFERHYNGRAALIRAIMEDDLDEARRVVDRVPGLSPAEIDRVLSLRRQTEQERDEIRQLGGLHVIGSERHESRRIDNQLRGRAARQGDPGSSRFYLSFDDELMLRFGGERMNRFKETNLIPDDVPIDLGAVGRIIESAQERIEGYNFDIRKNLVEYDDVMARQREAVYVERRAIVLGGAVDVDARIEKAFGDKIDELAENYLDNYLGFVAQEVERVLVEFTTDATDSVNLPKVLRRLRGLLPGVDAWDLEEMAGIRPEAMRERLFDLARDNQADGTNLFQLLRAMSRFIPLLPAIPNLARLTEVRRGRLQYKENNRVEFLEAVQTLFDKFLAQQVDEDQRQTLWEKAVRRVNGAYGDFSVEQTSRRQMESQQLTFQADVLKALNDLLLDSLSALSAEQLVTALNDYVAQERESWREQIGDDQFQRFQRAIVLNAVDREWQDYLTAMDDLRREITLQSIAQRDPKVEYKRRSYEMFQDMRSKVNEAIADRFFVDIRDHQARQAQLDAAMAYREQLSRAGYQIVQRGNGKGYEIRRDMPKVGRNDPCPCGSGKKYKHCHLRQDRAAARGGRGRRTGKAA